MKIRHTAPMASSSALPEGFVQTEPAHKAPLAFLPSVFGPGTGAPVAGMVNVYFMLMLS